jgi:hypothetical protein
MHVPVAVIALVYAVISAVKCTKSCGAYPEHGLLPVYRGGSEVVALEVLIALLWIRGSFLHEANRLHGTSCRNDLSWFSLAAPPLFIIYCLAWSRPPLEAGRLNPASFNNQLILTLKASLYFLLAQLPLKAHGFLFSTVPWLVLKNQIFPGDEKSTPRCLSAPSPGTVYISCFLFFISIRHRGIPAPEFSALPHLDHAEAWRWRFLAL